MKLTFTRGRAIRSLMVSAVLVLAAVLGHADLKVSESMTFDMSKMEINGQPVSDQMKQQMEKMPMFGGGSGPAMTLYAKTNMVRVDMQMMSMITNVDAKTMTMVNPSAKTYYTQPIPDYANDPMTKSMTVDVKDRGDSQTILGYVCHGYDVTVSGTRLPMAMVMTLYVADDVAMPTYNTPGNPIMNAMMAKWKDKIHGYPLKTVVNMTSNVFGAVTTTMTVTSISKDSLPDSLFQPPDGFTKVDAPKMPEGFSGAPH